jgi:FlaA1/EpsC-like NDP-sugar epimerase
MILFSKIRDWYLSRKALPYWTVFFADSVLLLLSGYIAFFVFNKAPQIINVFLPLTRVLLITVVLSWPSMRIFATYAGIIRFSSFVDLRKVVYANMLSCVFLAVAHYLVYPVPKVLLFHINTRMILVMYIVATLLMCGFRILVKSVYDNLHQDSHAMRALIFGTMSGGVAIAKSISTQKPTTFLLYGFITQDEHNRNSRLMGQRIYGVNDDLKKLIEQKHIQAILVSPLLKNEFRDNVNLQNTLINAGVKIFMTQDLVEFNNVQNIGANEVSLKEISVEDLLPRDEISVDMKAVGEELCGKRILITGSAGSIGSEIVRQVAAFAPEAMMLIDQAETPQHDIRLMMQRDFPLVMASVVVTSICCEERMRSIFADFRPDYVFHAAAYKHVPMMEDNPYEAVHNNVLGTKIMADLADEFGVDKFVMISTDKAVNPTNVMGCSKRICEIYVQSLGKKSKTQFVTTRFGNVLGSNGSVIPLFQKQIKHGGPVTVTHPDITRFFMLIPEACKLVLEAATKGHGGEVLVFDMGKPVRIADLAEKMIKMSKAKDVKIEYTGLRDGEKLYEEVLAEQEFTKPSFHKKIRVAMVREYDFDKVSKDIDQLIEISKHFNDIETVRKMKQIVPEYKSNNSVYEILDTKDNEDE